MDSIRMSHGRFLLRATNVPLPITMISNSFSDILHIKDMPTEPGGYGGSVLTQSFLVNIISCRRALVR